MDGYTECLKGFVSLFLGCSRWEGNEVDGMFGLVDFIVCEKLPTSLGGWNWLNRTDCVRTQSKWVWAQVWAQLSALLPKTD